MTNNIRYFNRRDFVRLAGASLLGCLPVGRALAAANRTEALLPDAMPLNSPKGRVWVSPPNCYFTYPHCNGFLPGGNPVIGHIGDDNHTLTYLEWDFRAGDTRPIYQTTAADMYWDIAARSGDLATIKNRREIVVVPTQGSPKSETIARFNATPSARIEDLLSITAAGDKVLYAIGKSDNDPQHVYAAEFFEVNRHTGVATSILAVPFNADHPQYCPHDESWIGFAHEGDTRASHDRIWALRHQGKGNAQPIRLWDETLADKGVGLVGHERWAFHTSGALAVAYPESDGRPRGLYFVDATSRHAVLVSASDYDLHCNISRDGKWAVVDTKHPPHRAQEADGRSISDIVLVNMSTGKRQWLARSHLHQFHPWHPHPHFSPDAKYVIYNDYQRNGAGTPSFVVITEVPS